MIPMHYQIQCQALLRVATAPDSTTLLQAPPHFSRLRRITPSSATLLQAPRSGRRGWRCCAGGVTGAVQKKLAALRSGRSCWRHGGGRALRGEELALSCVARRGAAVEREDVLAPWSWRSVAGKELAVPEVVVLKLLVLCLYAGAGRMSYTLNRGEARLGNYRSHFGVGSTMHVRRW
jgi:hypothetical protein